MAYYNDNDRNARIGGDDVENASRRRLGKLLTNNRSLSRATKDSSGGVGESERKWRDEECAACGSLTSTDRPAIMD